MEHIMAIDLGTGSCRAIVFDETGDQVAVGQREWSHAALPGFPGSQVFDTARNWQLIGECTREALSKSGLPATGIRAVSSTSMREGMVLWDAEGNEIWACPNVDSRAVEEAGELVRSGDAERLYDIGGDWVAITSPARFRWIRRHQPDVADKAAHVTMLSDWALTKLSGEYATDPSCGSSSDLFDLRAFGWSKELIGIVGFDPSIFPPVVDPGTVIGLVTAKAAAETGLAEGTPVVMGGADTQLGLLGIGVTRPGRRTVVAGSFWQTTVVTDRCLIDPQRRLRTLCHVLPGHVDDRGDRVLLRDHHALVPGCLLRLGEGRGGEARRRRLRGHGGGRREDPARRERRLGNLQRAHGRQALDPRLAVVPRLQRGRSRGIEPRRLCAGGRGGGGVRRARPHADHRRADAARRAPMRSSPAAAPRASSGRRSSPTPSASPCASRS